MIHELYYEYMVCLLKAQSLSDKIDKHFKNKASKSLTLSDKKSLKLTQSFDEINVKALKLKAILNAEKRVFYGY